MFVRAIQARNGRSVMAHEIPLILIGLVLLYVLGRILWMYWVDFVMEKGYADKTNRNHH